MLHVQHVQFDCVTEIINESGNIYRCGGRQRIVLMTAIFDVSTLLVPQQKSSIKLYNRT